MGAGNRTERVHSRDGLEAGWRDLTRGWVWDGGGDESGWRDTWSPRLRRVPIRSCLHLLKMLLYCLLAFHAAAGNLMSNKFLFVCKCTCVYVCAYIECMYVRVCVQLSVYRSFIVYLSMYSLSLLSSSPICYLSVIHLIFLWIVSDF